MSKKIPVIFILGSGHCGSTLLDLLLSTHPDMFGGGEIQNATKDQTSMCTCGVPVPACSVWEKTDLPGKLRLHIARAKKSVIKQEIDFFNPFCPEVKLSNFIEENIAMYQKLLEVSGKKIIVDSSKNPDRVRALLLDPRIDPYVIHLVRDGRANTWSYIKKYKKVYPFLSAWFLKNMKVELLRREVTVPWLRVHYAQLTEQTKETMDCLASMIGCESEFDIVSFRNYQHHQIACNRMRHKSDNVIVRDMKWKKEMPVYLQITVLLLFGWLNVYYYYRT